MISRRSSAYSSMIRRASSRRDGLGGGSWGPGPLVGVMGSTRRSKPSGALELNQTRPLRIST